MTRMPIKLLCVAGARPNFMKLAPLYGALAADPAFLPVLVHTGQHYDDSMSGQFFRDLELPEPAHHLHVGSASHAAMTAEVIKRFEPVVLDEAPAGVVVVGDVNSTMACALVAAKLQVAVVHVEAGLRSFDRAMPEEINRVVTDAIADLLLVTEESGCRNLAIEGIPEGRFLLVGNLMVDTLRKNLNRARASGAAVRLGMGEPPWGLVTLHRPANVDDPERLREVLSALVEISNELPLYFPVHPRTRSRIDTLQECGQGRIRLLEPLGYLDFLALMEHSTVVLTDSGGIQEETTALGVPCLTLRDNTERPITIEEGTNLLAGTTRRTILTAWHRMRKEPKTGRIPKYWDGQAAARCLGALRHFYGISI